MDPKAEMKMPSARIMTPFRAGPVPPVAIPHSGAFGCSS